MLEKTDEIDSKCTKIITALMQTNTLIEDKAVDVESHFDIEVRANRNSLQSDINEIKQMLRPVVQRGEISLMLKDVFKCKICHKIPNDGIAFAQCCGQIVGCTQCLNRWFEDEETCPLCRNDEGINKVIPFRGFDEVLKKII